MKRVQLIITAIFAVIISSVFIYAGEPNQEKPSASPDQNASSVVGLQDSHQPSSPGEKKYVATVGPDGIQKVSIIGGEYYFDPNYIIVKVNVPVELTVTKTKGFIPHDIIVKALEAGIDFNIKMSDKEPEKIKFTPTRVGKFEMICDKRFLFFKSHKDRGMKGTIEVVP